MYSLPGPGALVKLLKVSILFLAHQLTMLLASFFFLAGAGLSPVRGTLLEVMLAFTGGGPGRDDFEVVVVPGGDGREAGAGQGLGLLSVVMINCLYRCLPTMFLQLDMKASVEHYAKLDLIHLMKVAIGGYTEVWRVLLDK